MFVGRNLTLGDIAKHINARLLGDAYLSVCKTATLEQAGPGALSFLSNKKYYRHLANTKATAVILAETDAAACPTAALVHSNPQLAYAKVVRLMYPQTAITAGIHPTAVIDATAKIDVTACIGPLAVIGAGVDIGPRVFVGPGCVVEANCQIGADSQLIANVTLCHETCIGCRVSIKPGAVIGADGFGFVKDQNQWLHIPQIGRVHIGNDVEIGANTTIDRGSLEDTVIADGAILDNLIQIAHNVHIGQRTAIVACTGISGSTHIGKDCLIGGDVGIAGHLEIGDQVYLAAGSKVTRNLKDSGNYGGVLPVDPEPLWRRNIARLRHLDELVRRIKQLERYIKNMTQDQQSEGEYDNKTPDI